MINVSEDIKNRIFKWIEEGAPVSTGDVQGLQTGLDPTYDDNDKIHDKEHKRQDKKKKKKDKIVRREVKNKSNKI